MSFPLSNQPSPPKWGNPQNLQNSASLSNCWFHSVFWNKTQTCSLPMANPSSAMFHRWLLTFMQSGNREWGIPIVYSDTEHSFFITTSNSKRCKKSYLCACSTASVFFIFKTADLDLSSHVYIFCLTAFFFAKVQLVLIEIGISALLTPLSITA